MDIDMTIAQNVSFDPDPRVPPLPAGTIGVQGTTTINGRTAKGFVILKPEVARDLGDDESIKRWALPGLRAALEDLAEKDTERRAAAMRRTISDPYDQGGAVDD